MRTHASNQFSHKIHLLGICGTLMASIARLAVEKGFVVSGSDKLLAPPMSDQLKQLNVPLDANMQYPPKDVDTILIGNVMTRGQPIIEEILNQNLTYQSAPDWLYQNILSNRSVIAVSGTHGKTTVTSMIAWILDYSGLSPGFLIGGVAENFGVSSRLGASNSCFVIEADEYDSAFFDKRPKFLHYHPQILLINNLEFDHADIYANLSAIQQQFHFLLRQLPGNAKIIYPHNDENVQRVIQQGCWSKKTTIHQDWQLQHNTDQTLSIFYRNEQVARGLVPVMGEHNRNNVLSAIAVCYEKGVLPTEALKALQKFKGVKRRLEIIKTWHTPKGCVRLIDDFAHHPTAIKFTLRTLKEETVTHQSTNRVIALLDLTTNSMKKGVYKDSLAESLVDADVVYVWQSQGVAWDVVAHLHVTAQARKKIKVYDQTNVLVQDVISNTRIGDDIVMLSNGTFGNLSGDLQDGLEEITTKLNG